MITSVRFTPRPVPAGRLGGVCPRSPVFGWMGRTAPARAHRWRPPTQAACVMVSGRGPPRRGDPLVNVVARGPSPDTVVESGRAEATTTRGRRAVGGTNPPVVDGVRGGRKVPETGAACQPRSDPEFFRPA